MMILQRFLHGCSFAGIIRWCVRITMLCICLLAMAAAFLKFTLWQKGSIALPFEPYIAQWLQVPNYSVHIRGLSLVNHVDSILPILRVQLLRATPTSLKTQDNTFVVQNARIALAPRLLWHGQARIAFLEIDRLDLSTYARAVPNTHVDPSPKLPTLNDLWQTYFAEDSFGASIERLSVNNLTFDTQISSLPVSLQNGSLLVEKHASSLAATLRGRLLVAHWLQVPIYTNATYDAITQQLSGTIGPGGDASSNVASIKGQPVGTIAFVTNNQWQVTQFEGTLQCNPCALRGQGMSPDIRIDDMVLDAKHQPQKGEAELSLSRFQSNIGNGSALLKMTGLTLSPTVIEWQLSAQAHQVQYNNTFAAPLSIDGLHMSGRYHVANQQLQIGDIDLQSMGVRVLGTLESTFMDTKIKNIRSFLRVQGLNAQRLLAIWPINLPGTARSWLQENLAQATAKDGTVEAHATWPNNTEAPQVRLKALLPLNDVVMSYARPMTPLKNGQALLTLTQDDFTAHIQRATIGNTQVQGSFKIADINALKPVGVIDAQVKSTAPDILNLLDEDPLKLIRRNGLEPKDTKGQMQGTLHLRIPLVQDLKVADIDFNVQAQITNGALPIQNKRWQLSNGRWQVQATPQRVSLQGTGNINTVPVSSMRWDMDLTGKKTPDTTIAVAADASIDDLTHWGPDMRFMLQGRTKGSIDIKMHKNAVQNITITGDAAAAKLQIAGSNIVFNKGLSKPFRLAGKPQDNGDMLFDSISVQAADSFLKGHDLTISPHGNIALRIDEVLIPPLAHMRGMYQYTPQTGTTITGDADFLDIAPYLGEAPEGTAAPNSADRIAPFSLQINTKQLRMGEDTRGDAATVKAQTTNNGLGVEGSIAPAKGHPLALQWIRHKDIATQSVLRSNNAGGLLNYFSLYQNLQGGSLELLSHGTKNGVQKGHLLIKDATFKEAPIITKILSLASLEGALNAITSQGLVAEYIKTDFQKSNEAITFSDGILRLPAVGISFRGDYQRPKEQLNMEGAVIPFYSVNSLLNDIPLLGNIIGNRSEEGLLGISYTLKGSTSAPDVSINPLSVVTPGFLRGLFEK